MQQRYRQTRRHAAAEARFDPIALTLAMWLGAVVAVTGLVQVSETVAIHVRESPGQQARTQALAFAMRPTPDLR